MTKFYNEIPQLNLQYLHVDDKCALFIWINFVIHASTSIFAFKCHILNLMKGMKKREKKHTQKEWKQQQEKRKKRKKKLTYKLINFLKK